MHTPSAPPSPLAAWRAPSAPRSHLRPGTPRALALALLLAASAPACRPSIGSVGAVFRQEKVSGRVWVRRVEPSMDGARAGLEPGDEVLSVEGRDVRDLSPEGVHQAFAGAPGSTVTLTVARRGTIEQLRVVRKPYRKPSAATKATEAPAPPGQGAPE